MGVFVAVEAVRQGASGARLLQRSADPRRRNFGTIYAPGTGSTPPESPALYRFYLAHTWSTQTLPNGAYELQVEASDLAGNTGSLTLPFSLANNL